MTSTDKFKKLKGTLRHCGVSRSLKVILYSRFSDGWIVFSIVGNPVLTLTLINFKARKDVVDC